jgi:hypothetical protein
MDDHSMIRLEFWTGRPVQMIRPLVESYCASVPEPSNLDDTIQTLERMSTRLDAMILVGLVRFHPVGYCVAQVFTDPLADVRVLIVNHAYVEKMYRSREIRTRTIRVLCEWGIAHGASYIGCVAPHKSIARLLGWRMSGEYEGKPYLTSPILEARHVA